MEIIFSIYSVKKRKKIHELNSKQHKWMVSWYDTNANEKAVFDGTKTSMGSSMIEVKILGKSWKIPFEVKYDGGFVQNSRTLDIWLWFCWSIYKVLFVFCFVKYQSIFQSRGKRWFETMIIDFDCSLREIIVSYRQWSPPTRRGPAAPPPVRGRSPKL